MRTNLPVTQRELDFPANSTLMSTTDSKGRITYANAAFVSVSGFTRDELMGQPHNLVRHPDMPSEAYADMWATIQAGRSWTALVKNRRKDGDHYWVRANAAPIVRGGQTVGYISVRTKPSREDVSQAETLYRDFREGKVRHLAFREGLLVRTGFWRWTSLLQLMCVCWRIRLGVAFCPLCVVLGAALMGLHGWALWGVTLAAMAGAAGADWFLEAQISRPLKFLQRKAQRVATGQPDTDVVQLNRIDEIGMILRSINQAGLNLRALVDDVGEQVSGLSTASAQIAQGNNDLSSRTEQAASSLQQTAASMEEMTASIRNNAETASQASSLAAEATHAATQGGDAVERVVETMHEISRSSTKISDIIGVIDAIAFQTNILALNAAVEAARAGDQGRGFAVVAAEVRSLAKRSAEAAKEIKALIGDSVD